VKTVVPIQEASWRNEAESYALREFAHKIQLVVSEAKSGNLPGILVEVGSFLGESTRIFADAGWPVIAVDAWKNGYDKTDDASELYAMGEVYEEFQRRSRTYIKDGLIVPLRGTSADIAKLFAPNSVSAVYIDGEHTKEAVLSDLESWYSKVFTDGVIAGHDWNYTGVQEAVHFFIEKLWLSSVHIPAPEAIRRSQGCIKVDAYHNWYFTKLGVTSL
jgi:hypothetical protein